MPTAKTTSSSPPIIIGNQNSVFVNGLYLDGSSPRPSASHSAAKIRAGSLRSSARITSNLPRLSWRKDRIIRHHAKQRIIPLTPRTAKTGPAMLFAAFSRIRRPMAAKMRELTERKKVLTCCRRETRASEVPTMSSYCSNSTETSSSFGVEDSRCPNNSCSTVSGSDGIQFTYYFLYVFPPQEFHVEFHESGGNCRHYGFNGNSHHALA